MSDENNPVRLGLAGLNFGAGLADRKIFGTDAERYVKIVAVCDLDRNKAKAYAERHELPVCRDLDEMLGNPDIEAVMLMTPPVGRAALIHQCLSAGKHVLTTKPFELDPEAAIAVLKEARRKNLAVHLNSPAPLPSADLLKIREWQRKYDLGDPVSGHWETYAMYHEKANGSWLDSPEKCPAAPVFRLGIYGINELVAVMGEVSGVEVVSSRMRTGRPTADNAGVLIRFAGGAIGSIYASLCIDDGKLYPASLILHFERGTIFKTQERVAGTDDFSEVTMRLQACSGGKLVEESCSLPAGERSGSYQFENFFRAVRNGGGLPGEISPETIAAGIRVIAEMRKKESPEC